MTFKQELKKPKYHIHLIIIVAIVLFGLQQFFGHDMLSFDWAWKFYLLILIGDVLSHNILKLD